MRARFRPALQIELSSAFIASYANEANCSGFSPNRFSKRSLKLVHFGSLRVGSYGNTASNPSAASPAFASNSDPSVRYAPKTRCFIPAVRISFNISAACAWSAQSTIASAREPAMTFNCFV